MSGGDGYVPLHWQPDLGGAQAEENLARLEYFQRTREERLGEDATPADAADADTAEEPEPPDGAIRGHGCSR